MPKQMRDCDMIGDVVFDFKQFSIDALNGFKDEHWYFTFSEYLTDKEIRIGSQVDFRRADAIIHHIQKNINKFKHWRQIVDFFQEHIYRVSSSNDFGQRNVSLSTRFDVIKRDGYKCVVCGRSSNDGITLEIDHIVPVSKGGIDAEWNLQTLCFDCNRGKGVKFM